jgi:hypothetical protein
MLLEKIYYFLISPVEKTKKSIINFWLFFSLTFGLIYSLQAMQTAFAGSYIVQDDTRQHVFWMMRFLDPELFPNDLIADYFQAVAPYGYKIVYYLPSLLGINPFFLSKILPLFLCLITTYYLWQLTLKILPIPLTAFMTTLMFNQALWMKDDLASATPRAFIYPLFLAFLYYLLEGSKIAIAVIMILIGLFYPQYIFIASVILIIRLITWSNGQFKLVNNKSDYALTAIGLIAGFIVLLPFVLNTSEYGPTINRQQALQLPEFLPGGRSVFFRKNPFSFWINGQRSGMFGKSLFTPVTQCAIFLLPLLILLQKRFSTLSSRVIPSIKYIQKEAWVMWHLFLSSIILFFLAHAVIFKLHLPSRYTGVGFRIIVALGSAIIFTFMIDALLNWLIGQHYGRLQPEYLLDKDPINHNLLTNFLRKLAIFMAWLSLIVITIGLLCYPLFVKQFPMVKYKVGHYPALYQFLATQPKDIMIASLQEEVNQLPSLTQRSILVGKEYAIPYHVGYYTQFRSKLLDVISAQYTPNLTELKNIINKYDIDFWLLLQNDLTAEKLANNDWLKDFSTTQTALNSLQQGNIPALAQVMPICTVFQDQGLVLVDTKCILKR